MRNSAPHAYKNPVTWILVADAHHAQVYARHTEENAAPTDVATKHPHFIAPTERLVPVSGMGSKAESSAIYDAGSKDPAKAHDNKGFIRHGTDPHVTTSDELKQHFTTQIADELSRACAKKSFDKLVLIAPSKMLGDLRAQLDKSVLPHVIGSLSKDLTHLSASELAAHLNDSPEWLIAI